MQDDYYAKLVDQVNEAIISAYKKWHYYEPGSVVTVIDQTPHNEAAVILLEDGAKRTFRKSNLRVAMNRVDYSFSCRCPTTVRNVFISYMRAGYNKNYNAPESLRICRSGHLTLTAGSYCRCILLTNTTMGTPSTLAIRSQLTCSLDAKPVSPVWEAAYRAGGLVSLNAVTGKKPYTEVSR